MQDAGIIVNQPIRWKTEDLKRIRKKYKSGRKIMVKVEEFESGPEFGRKKSIRFEEFEVIATYPFHVLCKNSKGTRQSFGYFELEQIVVQEERPVGGGGCGGIRGDADGAGN